MATLLEHVQSALSSFPGAHRFTLELVRSQPRRSHALFPHATNLRTKVWQEELLLVVSEQLPVPPPTPTDDGASASAADTPSTAAVPVFALEASVYTIPSTRTALLYVSKVDTTGLGTVPSPSRTVAAAFLAYQLANPPHASTRLRIHIFAKAQGQYLFPASAENPGKHVLDDQGLLRWWKRCISQAVAPTDSFPPPQLFYLVPGLSMSESLRYVPMDDKLDAHWRYGHPYATVGSPLFPAGSTTPATLNDLIPAFPDDPKSRFLTSLTSSAISATGEPDDYDDLMSTIGAKTFVTGNGGPSTYRDEIERERDRERQRLIAGVLGGVSEWWERMAFRQECCSGVLVGFFVVVSERVEAPSTASGSDADSTIPAVEAAAALAPNVAPTPCTAALPHAAFTTLWSQFHNVDYSTDALAKLAIARAKWSGDLELLVKTEGHSNTDTETGETRYNRHSCISFAVDNPMFVAQKRVAEPVAKVNVMVPRKKKKV